MRSRNARIVVVGAMLATSLGACSGGGVSKEEFIDAADSICRRADEAIREVGVPRVEEGVQEYVDQATEIGEELVSDLRELERPEGSTEAVDRMIEGIEEALGTLAPLADAIVDRDSDAVADLQQRAERVTDEITEAAESYGFETCGGKVLQPTS